jgi:hypothetical protein
LSCFVSVDELLLVPSDDDFLSKVRDKNAYDDDRHVLFPDFF